MYSIMGLPRLQPSQFSRPAPMHVSSESHPVPWDLFPSKCDPTCSLMIYFLVSWTGWSLFCLWPWETIALFICCFQKQVFPSLKKEKEKKTSLSTFIKAVHRPGLQVTWIYLAPGQATVCRWWTLSSVWGATRSVITDIAGVSTALWAQIPSVNFWGFLMF